MKRSAENRLSMKRSVKKRMLLVFIAFALSILLYVVSAGPVTWMACNGWFGNGPVVWTFYVYAPVWWAAKHLGLLEELIWYVKLGC